jgi:hypothetical protein
MRSYQVGRPDTAFSRGPTRRKRPRQRMERHLKWIRTLPCVICGKRNDIHAAHLRAASLQFGKLAVGIAEKPDDCWTTPLCGKHHLYGEEAQHQGQELDFWKRNNIDPFGLALALWRASGDDEVGFLIVGEFASAVAAGEVAAQIQADAKTGDSSRG